MNLGGDYSAGPKVDHRGLEVEHARHDPAIALASIFRPVSRGVRPKLDLTLELEEDLDGKDLLAPLTDVNTEFSKISLRFTCFDALDSRDQSVLFAAIGLAGLIGQNLSPDNQTLVGQELWSGRTGLKPHANATTDDTIVITTSKYALLQAADMPTSGGAYERLDAILYRLSQVGILATRSGWRWSMNLLAFTTGPNGVVHIALNSRFAMAIAGHHVRIDLTERRKLNGDTAKILHAWLIAATRPGRLLAAVKLDTLVERVWGSLSANAATNRKRRGYIKDALEQIGVLGNWSVEIRGSGSNSRARILRKPHAINDV